MTQQVGEHFHLPTDGYCSGCGFTPEPRIVHEGSYTLWATPDGGRHLVYRPDGAPADVHVPDIPRGALPLVENFLTHGLPPQIVALLGQLGGDGKVNRGQLLGMFRAFSGQLAAADNGNGDASGPG